MSFSEIFSKESLTFKFIKYAFKRFICCCSVIKYVPVYNNLEIKKNRNYKFSATALSNYYKGPSFFHLMIKLSYIHQSFHCHVYWTTFGAVFSIVLYPILYK